METRIRRSSADRATQTESRPFALDHHFGTAPTRKRLRRRTVWMGDLGDELNKVYRHSIGDSSDRDLDLCGGDEGKGGDGTGGGLGGTASNLATTTISFAHGSERGPIMEFNYKAKHTPGEQDAIISFARKIADLHMPAEGDTVVARHLNFWSDWSMNQGLPHVGLHITYWLRNDES